MARRTEYERVAAAFEASGRSVPFVCGNGLVCVWLFPGGWHIGSTELLLTRLKDRERDSVLYSLFAKVEGDPIARLNAASPKKGK